MFVSKSIGLAINTLILGLVPTLFVSGTEKGSFTIAFMANKRQCSGDLMVFISASSISKCTVSAPKFDALDNISVMVYSYDVSVVRLPRTLQLSTSDIEPKGISISCNDTITAYGMNACEYSTDGFLAIPDSDIGTEYYTFTVYPTRYFSQIAVVSRLDNTEVLVTLPSCETCADVVFDGVIYRPGSQILKTINAYECLNIRSVGMLAGAFVKSNNKVSLFCGNANSGIDGKSVEHLSIQVPPINTWGKRYAVVPTPDRLSGDHLYVLTGFNKTFINIWCKDIDRHTIRNLTDTYVEKAGDYIHELVDSNEQCLVNANEPVLVVQALATQNDGDDGDHSFICLTPIDQYSNNYTFQTLDSSFLNYFLYIIENSELDQLVFDFDKLPLVPYNPSLIPGTSLSGGFIPVNHGVHYVSHPTFNFSGIVIGRKEYESYAVSLGRNWIQEERNEVNNEVAESPDPNQCFCPCPKSNKWQNLKLDNMTKADLIKLVLDDFNKNIKPEIMVNTKNVSRAVRKRISSTNKDPSAVRVGWAFSWLAFLPLLFAIVFDLPRTFKFCAAIVSSTKVEPETSA